MPCNILFKSKYKTKTILILLNTDAKTQYHITFSQASLQAFWKDNTSALALFKLVYAYLK